MKINSVTLKFGGLKGLTLSYQTMETNESGSFVKEHKISYRKPVQGILKEKFMELAEIVREVCNIKEDATVRVNAIDKVDEKDECFNIHATIICEHVNKMYDITTPILAEIDGIPGFDEAFESVKSILDLAKKHMESKEKLDSRQVLIDFKERMPSKLEGMDIDSMSEADQVKKATEILEKLGGYVMLPENLEDATAVEEEIIADAVEEEIVADTAEEIVDWPEDEIQTVGDPFADQPQEKPAKKKQKLKVA